MRSQKSGSIAQGSQHRANLERTDYFFKLSEVILFLKRQGYPLKGTNVSYYSAVFSAFVNCNIDPIGDFVHIYEKDLETIDQKTSLRLRFDPCISEINLAGSENSSDVDEQEGSVHESHLDRQNNEYKQQAKVF